MISTKAVTHASLVLTLMLATSATASAKWPFEGKWTEDPSQCSAPQSNPAAPLEISSSTYQQYTKNCSLDGVKDEGDNVFKISATCDGNATSLTLTVSGNTLTVSDPDGARDLLQCP